MRRVWDRRLLLPHGNGLIAVYVAAIVLGIQRRDIRSHFERQAEDLVEIVKLGVFVVFGSLLTLSGLFGSGWAAVGVVVVTLLIARPVRPSSRHSSRLRSTPQPGPSWPGSVPRAWRR